MLQYLQQEERIDGVDADHGKSTCGCTNVTLITKAIKDKRPKIIATHKSMSINSVNFRHTVYHDGLQARIMNHLGFYNPAHVQFGLCFTVAHPPSA